MNKILRSDCSTSSCTPPIVFAHGFTTYSYSSYRCTFITILIEHVLIVLYALKSKLILLEYAFKIAASQRKICI